MADQPKPEQQTFNWMNENVEFAEGVSFDPAVDYPFELADILPKVTDKGLKLVECHWFNRETNVKLKTTIWVSGKSTVSSDGGSESVVARLARQLGYPVEAGKTMALKDIIRPGMKIVAKVRKQMEKDGKTPSRFSEIVPETIRLAALPAEGQKTMAEVLSAEDEATIKAYASISKDRDAATQALIRKDKGNLVSALFRMDAAGQLKYQGQ
jgi:hypothetical protein